MRHTKQKYSKPRPTVRFPEFETLAPILEIQSPNHDFCQITLPLSWIQHGPETKIMSLVYLTTCP